MNKIMRLDSIGFTIYRLLMLPAIPACYILSRALRSMSIGT